MAQRSWIYVYQDAQGKRHEGEMSAPNKDDVYAALREQGIRAQRVTERVQPIVKRGFGGLRARDWCIVSACALVALAVIAYFIAARTDGASDTQSPRTQTTRSQPPRNRTIESQVVELPNGLRRATPRPRRALSQPVRNLDAIFAHPSERLLAAFAQPGNPVPRLDITQDIKEDLVDALETDIMIQPTDGKDVAALKRMVVGLKEDVLELIGAGLSIDEVFYRYAERQRMEAEYRAGIVRTIRTKGDIPAVNARLSAMGMMPVDEAEFGHEKK